MRRATCISVLVLAAGMSVAGSEIVFDLKGGADYTETQSAIDAAKELPGTVRRLAGCARLPRSSGCE